MVKRELNKKDIYIILIACTLFIGGCILIGVSLFYGFAVSILLSCSVLLKKGFALNELVAMMLKGLKECRTLYALILLIGATVSIWLSSGVVPAMIYYGFEFMKGTNFLMAAFIIVSISAIFMGTAVGTISTIGIAVLGIGKGFGIPAPVLLGAIVSGAFIADKCSPISGLLNLTLSTTETRYKETIKYMLVTLIPSVLLAAAVYYFLGMKYSAGADSLSIQEFQLAIRTGFYISPYLLLMPILIVAMSILGIKIIYSTLMGLLSGIIISVVFQNTTLSEIIKSIIFGYKGGTASVKLNNILVSGGMISMVEVVLIVMGAIALSSLLEASGLIDSLTRKAIEGISTKGELIAKTGVISGFLTIATCDQTLGIVLPGRLLRKKYEKLNVSKSILARTISDTGTIIAPLMPWNVNSLIIGLVAGITSAYAPFAVLCYISPAITFICGRMKKTYATDLETCRFKKNV